MIFLISQLFSNLCLWDLGYRCVIPIWKGRAFFFCSFWRKSRGFLQKKNHFYVLLCVEYTSDNPIVKRISKKAQCEMRDVSNNYSGYTFSVNVNLHRCCFTDFWKLKFDDYRVSTLRWHLRSEVPRYKKWTVVAKRETIFTFPLFLVFVYSSRFMSRRALSFRTPGVVVMEIHVQLLFYILWLSAAFPILLSVLSVFSFVSFPFSSLSESCGHYQVLMEY